jgi:hypothetical protein
MDSDRGMKEREADAVIAGSLRVSAKLTAALSPPFLRLRRNYTFILVAYPIVHRESVGLAKNALGSKRGRESACAALATVSASGARLPLCAR